MSTQISRTLSRPVPAEEITRAGSGSLPHGSALNALLAAQVLQPDACQAAAPITQFGAAGFTKERADATRHIGGSARGRRAHCYHDT
jgi:hypothetical protein